jgi:hypothetical protein
MIGNKPNWDNAVKLIRQEYKDSYKQLTPNIDADGLYWLSLDWRMGQFTCNSIPNKMITAYTSAEQLIK